MQNRHYLWYDFESWGLDPMTSPVASFAAIITDEDFREVERVTYEVCPNRDRHLSATSAIINQFNPFVLQTEGIDEYELADNIQKLFAKYTLTSIGYNNSHYDNIVLRFLFFRTLLPVYKHEQPPHSTLDVLGLLRLAHALRPSEIKWPESNGAPSFKLESVAQANKIPHRAHDAMSDVEATLALAFLVKQHKPELFSYVMRQHQLPQLRVLASDWSQPYLYVDKYAGFTNHYLTPIAFCGQENNNSFMALNMKYDYTELLQASPESIAQHLDINPPIADEAATQIIKNTSVINKKINPFVRIGLKKSPIFAPISVISEENEMRLGLDKEEIKKRFDLLQKHNFLQKAQQAWKLRKHRAYESSKDIDASLYEFFIDYSQQSLLEQIRAAIINNKRFSCENLSNNLQPVVQQFIYRYFPDLMDERTKILWRSYLCARDRGLQAKLLQEWFSLNDVYAQDEHASQILTNIYRFNDSVHACN